MMESETIEMEEITDNQSLPNKNYLDLLKYTIYNKIDKLKNLLKLKKDDIDINYNYGRPFEKTLVEIACTEYAVTIKPECVLILLKHGADKELALTSAALGANSELLKTILEYISPIEDNIKYSAVILDTIQNMNNEVKENLYAECIKLLINYGIDINFTPNSSLMGPNAIFLAAQNNYALIVNIILSYSWDTVDLDCYNDAELGTARDIILMNKLYKNTLPPPKTSNTSNAIFLFEKHMDANNEYTFITEYTKMKNANEMYIENELLICAIKKGAITIVRYLICSGLNINEFDLNTSFPLFVACKKGYYKIAKILIDYSNSTYISAAFVMMCEFCTDKMEINQKKCFDLLLYSKKLNINYRIESTNKSGLYYAIKNQPNELVLKILDKGASLAELDLNETSWSVFLTPDVLAKHLDKCVKIDSVEEISNGINLSIDFSTLLHFENSTQYSNEIESKILAYICDKSEYYSVLQHPLIHIYLSIKRQNFFYLSCINLIIHLVFNTFILCHLVLPYFEIIKTGYLYSYGQFFLILIIIKIIINYLNNPVIVINCKMSKAICLFIISLVQGILTFFAIALELIHRPEFPTRSKDLTACVIIYTTLEIILISGRHFNFLFNTITILRSVMFTLFKLILPFSLLIFAYTFSFFILFHKEIPENGEQSLQNKSIEVNTTCKSLDKTDFFSNIGLTLFKTFLMLTGEFEASEIDFSSHPIVGPLLFSSFVFFMNIVLLGAFIVLAMDNLQQIKEIQCHRKRIKGIVKMDKIFKCTRCNVSKTIEMNLEYSKLTMKNGEKEIKINKKAMNALQKMIQEKKEQPVPFEKKGPALQHSI